LINVICLPVVILLDKKNISTPMYFIDLFAELRPELIAPVVAYLAHESCTDNGSVVEAAAGWAGKCHVVRSQGGLLRQRIGDPVTIEDVAKNWGKIVDMSRAERVETITVTHRVTSPILARVL